MAYILSYFIFLSIFLSFANCLKEAFVNISTIELYDKGCDKKEGKYIFYIKGTFIDYDYYHRLTLQLESPSNTSAICYMDMYQDSTLLCTINIVWYPLTDKKVVLPKKKPFSLTYDLNNWEDYINKNGNILSENLDCIPTIHNTFIYSSIIIVNDIHFIIKGDWLDKSKSLIPHPNFDFFVILINSTLKNNANCIYNLKNKNVINCINYG